MKANRVPGHTLPHEGRVYGGLTAGYISGPGRATCSCGASSEELPSTSSRKRWHWDHKEQVRAGSS